MHIIHPQASAITSIGMTSHKIKDSKKLHEFAYIRQVLIVHRISLQKDLLLHFLNVLMPFERSRTETLMSKIKR